ncbi:MAG: DUF4175 family protein [Candidatus Edwardsbacteria bacterium]
MNQNFLTSDNAYQILRDKLRRLRRQEFISYSLNRSLLFLSLLLIAFFLLLLINALLSPPPFWRTVFLFVSVSLVFFYLLFIIFSYKIPSDEKLAIKIEKHFPFLKEALITVIQLWPKRESKETGLKPVPTYSAEILSALLLQTYHTTTALDFSKVISRQKLFLHTRLLSGIVILLLAFAALSPKHFYTSLSHYITPSSRTLEQITVLKVSPQDKKILKGDNIVLTLTILGKLVKPEKVFLHLKSKGREWQREKMQSISEKKFSFKYENVQADFTYYLAADKTKTKKYQIKVIERPEITRLRLILHYPHYTKLPEMPLPENQGDITALIGTKISLAAESNVPIAKAKILFSDSTEGKVYQQNERSFTANFVIRKNLNYSCEIEDRLSHKNTSPEYQIIAIPDEFPTVRILEPEKDTKISPQMLQPLKILAVDDFGISKINLKYKKSGEEKEHVIEITKFSEPPSESTCDYLWDLASLNLVPGDVLSYYLEAFDNDTFLGPKKATSEVYTLHLPSIEQIYEEVKREQEEKISDLIRVSPEQKKLKEELDRLAQEIKKSKEINWENRQAIEEALKKQEELSKKVEQISRSIEEMRQRLDKSALFDEETLQKLQEMQKLLEEVATEEIKKALEQLRQAMQKLDPKMIQEAMKNLSLSQQELKERLDRTIEMLRNFQREQKMKSLVEKAKELVEKQEEIRKKTEKANESEMKELAQKEETLQKKLQEMQKEMEELAKEMKENEPTVSDSLSSLWQKMQRENIQENLTQAMKSLEACDKSNALTCEKQALEGLKKLSSGLQSAQSSMIASQKKAISEAMQRAMKDLLYLSQRQEELNQRMKEEKSNPSELATEQETLRKETEQVANDLYRLSQKTFFITPEIGRSLGQSLAKMKESAENLEKGSGSQAKQSGEGAMQSLNATVINLMKAQSELAQASSASGLQEMMQKLASLAAQQQGLNQQTQGLFPLPAEGGDLTPQQRAAMARLAAEQEILQKELEGIQKGLGKRGDVLGRLDQIGEEMKKVIEDLKKQNVNRQTIERQERILSRLLDASRSFRERDYRERRKSEPGKEIGTRPRPLALPADLGERKKQLREDLLKALKEGYPPEYEELIREYFKALCE